MAKAKTLGWLTFAVAVGILIAFLTLQDADLPALSTLLFWIALAIVPDLLPVALGFGTQITMSFPILLAAAIHFDAPVAMVISGLGAFDIREFKRQIPLWRALFNRSQIMLAVGAASLVLTLNRGDDYSFPIGLVTISLAAATYLVMNLALVALMMRFDRQIRFHDSLAILIPRPASGYIVSLVVLGGLGAATAAVYDRIGPVVASFLIPLLFARLSILGARAQQELSERVRKQQQALLEATERVFQE